jgi:hypothetical protein
MKSSLEEYLRKLASGVPALEDQLARSLHGWGADQPPVTVVFADLGNAIAENIGILPDAALRTIFATVEVGMTTSDDVLRTAVATGLVEALVSTADAKRDLWKDLDKLLGPASRKHAIAWRNFGKST